MSIPKIADDRNWSYELSKLINTDKPVQVYKNLHTKCWSVRQSGKVVAHLIYLVLKDCEFRVGKAGKERVRRENRKNVHAYVSGYVCNGRETYDLEHNLIESGNADWRWGEVTYNPYKYDSFVDDDGSPVLKSPLVDLDSGAFSGAPVMAAVKN